MERKLLEAIKNIADLNMTEDEALKLLENNNTTPPVHIWDPVVLWGYIMMPMLALDLSRSRAKAPHL